MPKRLLLLVVATIFCACKRGEMAAPGALQKAFERVPRSPACAVSLPMEWVSSWPIPTGGESGREFLVLFYSLDRRVEGADGLPRVRVTAPRGQAIFNTKGKVASCDIKPSEAKALRGDRYPLAAMRLEEEEFDKAVAELLRQTQAAAGFFGRKSAKPDLAVLNGFWAAFERFGEPALWPYYYKASPDFWDWLREKTGKSIPAPK